jgi:hypothetical protein
MNNKLEKLAKLISTEKRERFIKDGFTASIHEKAFEVRIKPGKKYTKVDVGDSGKYMIDEDENIWGIKAYGVIHKGHHYGTLDTVDEYYWGGYTAYKK